MEKTTVCGKDVWTVEKSSGNFALAKNVAEKRLFCICILFLVSHVDFKKEIEVLSREFLRQITQKRPQIP